MALSRALSQFLTSYGLSKEDIINDYRVAVESREVSTIGRKEVFMGKAKFGIFGGGKEVPQLAMARFFKDGDFRSGYYRDQTFMFAIKEMHPQQLFAQLYAHTDIEAEPVSGGRLMTGHFGTHLLNEEGEWLVQTNRKNSTVDISPTAAQMPRLVGLGYASKLYRQNPLLKEYTDYSINGNEIAFGTIGNASTAEGPFFESINAAGVLQIPVIVSVWDDDYGISVHSSLQITKANISEILSGFQRTNTDKGFEIFVVNGWDYPALIKTYHDATKICREEHVPVIIHVKELTQPGGHSTSGSHERYKPKERLDWELEYDCLKKMREWIIDEKIATIDELEQIETEAKEHILNCRNNAWSAYNKEIKRDWDSLNNTLSKLELNTSYSLEIENIRKEVDAILFPVRSDVVKAAKRVIRLMRNTDSEIKEKLILWHKTIKAANKVRYSDFLYNTSFDSALKVKEVPVEYNNEEILLDGRQILQSFFDIVLSQDPRIFAFGEDVGKIGDVNQGFAGLQDKHGDLRVTDAGIRECTILGQAIGAALRGLKPIAEIQYLDYILYAIQIMSDDLATLHYRSFGRQKAPVIVRTRGHRLEGVWHSGSPIGTLINALRGIYICVPRNMTQAAGIYKTLLKSSDPGLVIECLNGYRLKERLPSNLGEFTIPLGIPEIIRKGNDITIVTYGSMCRVVEEGADMLAEIGISCEIIDVRTLIPFDINKMIIESIKKTNRVLFADEDVPGGATAYMMQQVIERHEGYYYLDSKPKCIHAWAHRPAYATDGDYFSKPNADDIFDYVYDIMREVYPTRFKPLY